MAETLLYTVCWTCLEWLLQLYFHPRAFRRRLRGYQKFGEKGHRKRKARTLENNCFIWDPDAAKGPRILRGFKIYPTRGAWVVRENMDLRVRSVQISLNWVVSEFYSVFLWKRWEPCVKVGVLS